MKQPELGKKIVDLRKSKGLTQEELVEKCNLNVRTLQRIESGEVTPRSYTIKTIFTALDCSIYDSSESFNRFSKTGYIIFNWLEQFYRYVLDLFNLKTNTMKKITILSVPFITICAFMIFAYNSNVKAQSRQAIINKYEKTSSNTAFIRLFNSGEIDSLCMIYHKSACFMPDFPSIITGRENIVDYYRQLFNQGFHFTNLKSTYTKVNDSIAVERNVWAINSNANTILTGVSLTQWGYTEGQWQIYNSMSKTDKVINQEVFK